MSRPLRRPQAAAARLWADMKRTEALDAWNARQEKARAEYEAHPIVSSETVAKYAHPFTAGCVCPDCQERRTHARDKQRRRRLDAARKKQEEGA